MSRDPFLRSERKKSDPSRQGGQYIATVVGDVNLDPIAKAVYVGTAGTLVCILADDSDGAGGGTTSTFVNAFGFMPISIATIVAAGTTAADIQPLAEK